MTLVTKHGVLENNLGVSKATSWSLANSEALHLSTLHPSLLVDSSGFCYQMHLLECHESLAHAQCRTNFLAIACPNRAISQF